MILSIPFEEIKTFPKEIRLFLMSYFDRKLSETFEEENQVTLSSTPSLSNNTCTNPTVFSLSGISIKF